MTIKSIAILPPLAFARFGSHPEPVDSYTLELPPDENPLGFRRITPEPTLLVGENGEIIGAEPAEQINFKEEVATGIHQVRPVAPFFELWAELDDGNFVPVSKDVLNGAELVWRVEVANLKVFRRTQAKSDRITAEAEFSDHKVYELHGRCDNFIDDAYIAFGSVRYIKPNEKFPHIRLRFTPGAGLIYGTEQEVDGVEEPFLKGRRIYKSSGDPDDTKHRSWWKWDHSQELEDQAELAKKNDIETIPPQLFAIVPPAPPWLNKNVGVSRGYLDDACDGFVHARLVIHGKTLTAKARIGVAPPHYAPNSLFVRNLIDDLEQASKGPEIDGNSRERGLDIVRRAFETVRFLNIAVMNGNAYKGRDALELDTMPAEEAFGVERPLRPVFAADAADTRAIAALHQRAFTALTSGSAGWFAKLLRRPEDVGDLSDVGRRKMPALMCSAESLYLALTRRQISAIEHLDAPPKDAEEPWPLHVIGADELKELRPRNRTAELMYKPMGNPISSHPITAISNCCPGLEFDFRAVWRRLLEGIELVEHDNLVVEAHGEFKDLKGRRLLKIDDYLVITKVTGPKPSDPTESMAMICDDYPDGVISMEWSNNFARILQNPGRQVTCIFSSKKWLPRGAGAWPEDADEQKKLIKRKLRIRNFFEPDSLVISETLAAPGELTQGLCSPWQNDFRECSCYYWASSRPDYVNVTTGEDGTSRGDNWMQKERTGDYIADDYQNRELIVYDDLFVAWETILKFEVDGRDYGIDAESAEGAPRRHKS
jgi:hypothetical protein